MGRLSIIPVGTMAGRAVIHHKPLFPILRIARRSSACDQEEQGTKEGDREKESGR